MDQQLTTIKKKTDSLDDMERIVKRAQIFAARILQRSKGSDIQLQDPSDAAKLLNSIASLARAATELEKTKMEREGAIRIAARLIWNEMERKWLRDNPKLLTKLRQEMDKVQRKLLQQQRETPGYAVSGKRERIALAQAGEREGNEVE